MAELLKEKKHALSGWPMIIAWVAMIVFAIHSSTRMVGAGDTWVAMACGRHFINNGLDKVNVEPFSANSHEAGPTEEEIAAWPGWAQKIVDIVGLETVKKWHPTGWVNQNWLTHVIFYWTTHLSPIADGPPHNWEDVSEQTQYSYDSLALWKIGLYILVVISVYLIGRVLGVNPALSAVLACFCMFVGRSYFDIRPAGFSNLMVAIFLLILVLATYRNILYIWFLVPTTVFWCNLHGGYIYAFIMMVGFFGLHFLVWTPKKWTTCLYCIAAWLVLFMQVHKFLSYEAVAKIGPVFEQISLSEDWLIRFIVIFALGNLALTLSGKKIKPEGFYAYQIISTIIIFLWSLTRFLSSPDLSGKSQYYIRIVNDHIAASQVKFFLIFVVLIGLGLIIIFMKDRLICFSFGKLTHVAATGLVTFIACLIFNPFHLTNFTHTFIISVSKHAKQWRTIHEWHSAFQWDNPVGTGFPFLILVIITAGLFVFWLLSRSLMKLQLSDSKTQLSENTKCVFLEMFGWLLAIFICWTVFVSLSFCKVSTGFFISLVFVTVILLSIRFNIHYIYIIGVVTLIIVGLTGSIPEIKKFQGTYIFPFLILPTYVGIFIFAQAVSKKIKYKSLDIVFVFMTALVTVILMFILFKPFKFQEISGGPLSFIEQLFTVKRPWRPPYEDPALGFLARTYNRHMFKGIYIANLVSIILWFLLPWIKSFLKSGIKEDQGSKNYSVFTFGKIDIAYLAVCGLTIYMAYSSRRFIPIAAMAACPLIALFIQEIAKSISSIINLYRKDSLGVPEISVSLRKILIAGGLSLTIFFGTWWGLKFKRIYLDPWPQDDKLTSVFMRMTASYVKPFWACQFIRDNNMAGNMFNYWTEGGFIAYGQVPDPETGKTPLQLFMDGRAQAAYNTNAFNNWMQIMSGTTRGSKIVRAAKARRSKLNDRDYLEIGEALSEEFRKKKNDVWTVLMPVNDKTKIIVNSLSVHPEWAVVFYSNDQKLFVDLKTPQGQNLYKGITDGSTIFPNEFTEHLTKGYNLLGSPKDKEDVEKGLKHAIKALEIQPSQAAILEIRTATRYSGFIPRVATVLRDYVDDFKENQEKYSKQNNYMNRLITCGRAAGILANLASRNESKKIANQYMKLARQWSDQVKSENRHYTW